MRHGGAPQIPMGPGSGRGPWPGPHLFLHHAHSGHPLLRLLGLLIILLLVGLVVWFAARLAARSRPIPQLAGALPGGDVALESVRLRYARGEIDRDEFLRVRSDLGAPDPGGPYPEASVPGAPPGL
jgi:uncharacterized membrane protein